MSDVTTLSLGAAPDTGNYGNANKWTGAGVTGASDTDPVVDADISLAGWNGTDDIVLSVTGYDIDYDNEVEVQLVINGTTVSLGYLSTGLNDDFSASPDTFVLTAEQLAGVSPGDTVTVNFVQARFSIWKWGVTDLAVSTQPASAADLDLNVSDPVTPGTDLYGNKWTGATGASNTDPVVTTNVTLDAWNGSDDIVLTVSGYDVDYDDEVRVDLIAGAASETLGFLAVGVNDGVSTTPDTFTILGSDLAAAGIVAGDVIGVNFVEATDSTWKWGVKNIDFAYQAPVVPGTDLFTSVGGGVVPGSYGNADKWGIASGASDIDPVVAAEVSLSGWDGVSDIMLSVTGYDVDGSDEVRVDLVTSAATTEIGYLARGVNDGLSTTPDVFLISADLLAGLTTADTIEVDFVEEWNSAYKWGVTNIEFTNNFIAATDLTASVGGGIVAGPFGNTDKWAIASGATDSDPVVAADVSLSGWDGISDIMLTVTGYDIDGSNEVRVDLVTGGTTTEIGYLATGVNNGLSTTPDTFLISADLLAGLTTADTIKVDFVEEWNSTYKWGVADIEFTNNAIAQVDFVADVDGSIIPAPFGNADKWSGAVGASDTDPLVVGTVTLLNWDGISDVEMSVTGYDIDGNNEVAVNLVNGATSTLLGYLATGVNDGLSTTPDTFLITTEMLSGLLPDDYFIVEFEQSWNSTFKWGVTDIQFNYDVIPPYDLSATLDGGTVAGPFGNSDKWAGATGASDSDPVVVADVSLAGWDGTSDVLVSVTGYDVDYANEVRVDMVTGGTTSVLGYLAKGVNDAASASPDTFLIKAAELVGMSSLEIDFVQARDATWKWGVSDVSFTSQTPPAPDIAVLFSEAADTMHYGNGDKWAGATGASDTDPVLTAKVTLDSDATPGGWDGTSDVMLFVDGYDIDFANEVRVDLIAGAASAELGYLEVGPNDGIAPTSAFTILASDLAAAGIGQGDVLEIDFVQASNSTFKWGIASIDLDIAPSV